MIGLPHHVTGGDLRVGDHVSIRIDRSARNPVGLEEIEPMRGRIPRRDRFDPRCLVRRICSEGQPAPHPERERVVSSLVVDFQQIEQQADFETFCRQVAAAPFVGLDTEFVSEHTYRPELCLIQVAVGSLEEGGADHLAVLDPLALPSVAPFWQAIRERRGVTVIHGGREEVLFIHRAAGGVPPGLVDLQIVAALAGHGYPLGYGPLVSTVLGRSVASGEARTDWRRRPLTPRQLAYAVDDVRHLSAAYQRLWAHIDAAGRGAWLAAEMEDWVAGILVGETGSRWRKTKGAGRLSRRSLAVLKGLWQWRDAKAEASDRPPRRILRDDLLLELARRGSSDPDQLRSIRGMERGDYQRLLPAMAAAVAQALAEPESDWPAAFPDERETPRMKVLTQVLNLGLQAACEEAGVAAALVGTLKDLRRLIQYREAGATGNPPRLAGGWRAELVGSTLEEVLAGRVALRVHDSTAAQPLAFEPWGPTP